LAEATANVEAATSARYRSRLSADDVEAIYGRAGSVITGSAGVEATQPTPNPGFIEKYRSRLSPSAQEHLDARHNANLNPGSASPVPPPPGQGDDEA
jgi:hypothetical protein